MFYNVRQGSVLIIVAALTVVMILLSFSFFLRMRVEAQGSELVTQDAQARMMLSAACCYIQEAAAIGYATGDPGSPTFRRYGDLRFIDYWTGKIGSPPTYTEPAVPDLNYFGSYQPSPAGQTRFNKANWVGWYTPYHRGLYLTPWHQQDQRVYAWWQSYRQDMSLWEPRLRSRPKAVSGGNDPDPSPDAAGTKTVVKSIHGEEIYFDGDRAELTSLWPLLSHGGKPKLFQMYSPEEPPFSCYPHLVFCGKDEAVANGSFGSSEPWRYPPQSGGVAVQGKAALMSHINIYTDPHLLYYPTDDPARWAGRGTVLDFKRNANGAISTGPNGSVTLVDTGIRQDRPRPSSINRAWFRILRETHDRFIVTCGAGPSQGWRIRGNALEQAGTQVISDTANPWATVEDLIDAMESEVRLTYRVCWGPEMRGGQLRKTRPQSCNQGGSIRWIQRLTDQEVGALPDW